MKELVIIRGLPGSGKSTFAKTLGGLHVEADQYFVDESTNEYNFIPSKIGEAHNFCRNKCRSYMELEEPRIVVSNTFTQEWEMEDYFKMAEDYGYRVFCIIVENRHGGVNVHGVPDKKLDEMRKRFSFKI